MSVERLAGATGVLVLSPACSCRQDGVTAKQVFFNVGEQIVVGVGSEALELRKSTSTAHVAKDNIIDYPDGLNGLTTDVGSSIETLNSNGLIDIDTSASAKIAGLVEGDGVRAHGRSRCGHIVHADARRPHRGP